MEAEIESKINSYLIELYPNYNVVGKSSFKDKSYILCSDMTLFGFHINVYSFKKLCDTNTKIVNIVWELV